MFYEQSDGAPKTTAIIQQPTGRSQLFPGRTTGSATTDEATTGAAILGPWRNRSGSAIDFLMAWHRGHSSLSVNASRCPTVRRAFLAIDIAHELASGIIVQAFGDLVVPSEPLESCPKVDRNPDRPRKPRGESFGHSRQSQSSQRPIASWPIVVANSFRVFSGRRPGVS